MFSSFYLCCVLTLRLFSSFFFFFKQKTAYEMRISDWSSDVCSSDLTPLQIKPVIDLLKTDREGGQAGTFLESDFTINETRYSPYLRATFQPTADRKSVV